MSALESRAHYFGLPAASLSLRIVAILPPIIRSSHGKLASQCEAAGSALDLQSLARPDRGLASVVVAASFAFVFFAGFERARLVGCVLCAGALLQLSALHGDDLSRLPSRRRLPRSEEHT